ncbi:hypothetical protein [Moraxella phage Mcat22]|nr:hypothetical protein [Moraxella catarrhalis]AKI27815.1 hypothetical protein [Moraxella phage Mcat19]AKI27847.1 hypothetical protein [Moraxella phage Mcat20]AKI27926.1 hypothetical protein [Moraxella phage Mcat22]
MKVSVKIEGLKELDEQLGKIDKEFRGKSLYESLNFASQPMLNAARRGARVAEKRYRWYMSHGQGEATYVKTKNGKWRAGKSKRAKRGEGKFEWQEPGLLKKAFADAGSIKKVKISIEPLSVSICTKAQERRTDQLIIGGLLSMVLKKCLPRLLSVQLIIIMKLKRLIDLNRA